MSAAGPLTADRPAAVAVVIPAKDEAQRIEATVRAARSIDRVDTVVVVDDGSSDATAAVASGAGALVVRHHSNQGKAAAMATGARVVAMREDTEAADGGADFREELHAEPRMPGHTGPLPVISPSDPVSRALLFLDGDMEDSAGSAAPLVDAVLDEGVDMAIALLPPQDGAAGFGIVVRTARNGIRRVTGWEPEQPLSGTRCITREAWEACQPLAPGWGVETSLTIDALTGGFWVKEVPCGLRHRATGKDFAGQLHRAAQLRDVTRALLRRRTVRPPDVGEDPEAGAAEESQEDRESQESQEQQEPAEPQESQEPQDVQLAPETSTEAASEAETTDGDTGPTQDTDPSDGPEPAATTWVAVEEPPQPIGTTDEPRTPEDREDPERTDAPASHDRAEQPASDDAPRSPAPGRLRPSRPAASSADDVDVWGTPAPQERASAPADDVAPPEEEPAPAASPAPAPAASPAPAPSSAATGLEDLPAAEAFDADLARELRQVDLGALDADLRALPVDGPFEPEDIVLLAGADLHELARRMHEAPVDGDFAPDHAVIMAAHLGRGVPAVPERIALPMDPGEYTSFVVQAAVAAADADAEGQYPRADGR